MSKGTETRNTIISKAVGLFNRHGFAGVSMTDVMAATGLKKGGIYNHFSSKEELALAVFDHAIAKVRQRFVDGLRGKRSTTDRLRAIIEIMARYVDDPPVAGGCPIQNAAIESDDSSDFLRERARAGMNELQSYIEKTVAKGTASGELRAGAIPSEVASVFIATLEGALMLSRLYEDASHMRTAASHLSDYIEHRLVAG